MDSPKIAAEVKAAKIGDRQLSDHVFVSMEISQRGVAFLFWVWRLNKLLLDSPGIEEQLNKEIDYFFAWNAGTA